MCLKKSALEERMLRNTQVFYGKLAYKFAMKKVKQYHKLDG